MHLDFLSISSFSLYNQWVSTTVEFLSAHAVFVIPREMQCQMHNALTCNLCNANVLAQTHTPEMTF